MSYTLQLWEKPADWPWPGTKADADAQFERLADSPPPGQNPKFLDFGRALYRRFPPEQDVWLDGSEEGTTEDATLGFGLRSGTPHWDDAFEHAWQQASRLGLNLYDPQSGVHYLANGDVPQEPDLELRPALRARQDGNDTLAWAEHRRLAARGNPHAIYGMGRALRFGTMGQRRHFTVAAALQLLGAHDGSSRHDAQGFYDLFKREQQAPIQQLLARLRSGEPLLELVDRERKALDEAFERIERQMLDSRKRLAAADGLLPLALQGHEVAAYQYALESVIGWEHPNFENARYWCLRAADWDHPSARRLAALMCERGWGGPVDLEAAAQWRQQEAPADGGLHLEPLATAPVASSGSVRRDYAAWVARDGNPHAAYHMGTADEHGRDQGPVDMAQARTWYAQAAEAGHADATYNLGTFVESGVGGPKDALAATALYMLAHVRGSTVRAEGLRVDGPEQETVRTLVAALREPGRLRAVLQERAAGLPIQKPARAAAAPAPVQPSHAPSPTPQPAPPALEASDELSFLRAPWHLGHLALLIGVLSMPLLILLAKPGAGFRTGMAVLALVSAYGAWRAARDLDWSLPVRVGAALLAAVPIVGMAVCLGLLFKSRRAAA